jgi:gp16 family phage-associated protein
MKNDDHNKGKCATPSTLTGEEVRARFRQAGVTITGWAKANNFKRQTVVDCLNMRVKGAYGEAHRCCILLGLKDGEVIEVKDFDPRTNVIPHKVSK